MRGTESKWFLPLLSGSAGRTLSAQPSTQIVRPIVAWDAGDRGEIGDAGDRGEPAVRRAAFSFGEFDEEHDDDREDQREAGECYGVDVDLTEALVASVAA
jgi:hypothetical protein